MWEQRILDARSAQLGLRARAGGARVGRGRSGPSGPPYLLSWQMKGALTEIIQLATLDSDPWVLMVADILKSFPDTGSLNLDLEEQNPNVQDILGELREKVNECEASAMLPLECQYLNKNALTTLAGPLTPPVKHFQLKRKPKSATLRAELLQKSTETAQQLKRSAGVPFHAKGRGLLRKMDTTSKAAACASGWTPLRSLACAQSHLPGRYEALTSTIGSRLLSLAGRSDRMAGPGECWEGRPEPTSRKAWRVCTGVLG